MIKIKSFKNQTELDTGSDIVFYSYETPVAAFISGRGIVVSSKKYSKTTSKHIKEFISRNAPSATVSIQDQSWFNNLVEVNINNPLQ